MSKIEIYYFSGTGNSLHVSQEIQKRITDATLMPLLSLLNEEVIEMMASNSPKGLQPSFIIAQNWASTITEKNILALEDNEKKELDIIVKTIINKKRILVKIA